MIPVLRVPEIVRETVMLGEKHTRRAIANERYNLSRKDVKSLREKMKIAMRLSVTGEAQVLIDGETVKRIVRLWDIAPKWWNRADADQRRTWLLAFFARQLRCEPAQILGVRFKI